MRFVQFLFFRHALVYRQVGKIDGHCEKINYSVMNTLLDIDKARRCTASAVRYKNLREGYSGMQNKKNLLIYAHYYIPDTASTGQILR